MIALTPLARALRVTAAPGAPPLAPEIEAEIDRLWEEACRRRPLFDGRVFSIQHATTEFIHGHFVPYRRVVAQFARPDLASHIAVRQLGVTGLLMCQDGLVFGRRSRDVTHDPGLWEPVPSGAVDPSALRHDGSIDLAALALSELSEELGLDAVTVAPPVPVMLADAPSQHVADVVLRIACPLSAPQVLAAHARASAEYSEIAVVPSARLTEFASNERISPLCAALLGHPALTGKETLTE